MSTSRNVAMLVAGAAIGGIIAYVTTARSLSTDGARAPITSNARAFEETFDLEPPPPPATAAGRLETYRTISSLSDVNDLEMRLERAAAQRASTARDFEIRSLLARFIEIDAARATTVAQRLRFNVRHVASAFVAWAELDPTAALIAAAEIESAAWRADVLLALLDVYGADASTAAALSEHLPESARAGFLSAAYGRRAESDPTGAFDDALSGGSGRSQALRKVGATWGRRDPHAAIARMQGLPPTEQIMFAVDLVSEWARLDPRDLFDYLEANEMKSLNLGVSGLQWLVASDPQRVLGLVDRLPDSIGPTLAADATQALAARDAVSAIRYIDALAANPRRTELLQAAATGFARVDIEAALRWAGSLNPPSPDARTAVIAELARSDAARAFELATRDVGGANDSLTATSELWLNIAEDARMTARVADRLAAEQTARDDVFPQLVAAWAARDPNEVIAWITNRAETSDAATTASVAKVFASRDVTAAAALAERMPAAARGAWLGEVAAAYAAADTNAALQWIERYRGQDAYDFGLARIAEAISSSDPRRAAGMLTNLRAEAQRFVATRVGFAWASREPRPAADWALELRDPSVRASTVRGIVQTWAARDPASARGWVLEMRRDPTRDEALRSLLSLQNGEFDARLLAAFSSDAARQAALVRLIAAVARSNPRRADALIDQHADTPDLRRRIEAQIADPTVRRPEP